MFIRFSPHSLALVKVDYEPFVTLVCDLPFRSKI